MPHKVYADIEQGSDAWRQLRCGIPTASEFKNVIGIKKDAKDKLTRQAYMRRLAAELLTGEPAETYMNSHMERGKEQEPEARDLYAFETDTEPQLVGFIRNDKAGCSPDSLVGDDGMLEIKSALPWVLIEKIEKGEFPSEHVAQCQGNLWIAEREWLDIAIYCPKLPLFVKRAHRDNGYIANLAGAVEQFNEELHELVDRIRRYGGLGNHTPMMMAG